MQITQKSNNAGKACSKALKEKWKNDPEYREKMLKFSSSIYSDPEKAKEANRKKSEAMKKLWATKSYRKKNVKALHEAVKKKKHKKRKSKAHSTPEAKAKRSEIMKKYWSDEKNRKAMSDKIKKINGIDPVIYKRVNDYCGVISEEDYNRLTNGSN